MECETKCYLSKRGTNWPVVVAFSFGLECGENRRFRLPFDFGADSGVRLRQRKTKAAILAALQTK
jgi:hypothetical protein